MPAPINRPASQDDLFLWVMHCMTEAFAERAILKGGMALRLTGSSRATNDVDFVFCPYGSKKDIHVELERALSTLEDAVIDVAVHSKMIRASIRLDGVAIQVEANVAKVCASIPMSTASLAQKLGQAPRVIRVVDPRVAFANKLAAWNERRLLRDLYDCVLFADQYAIEPDYEILDARLQKVVSRLPQLKKVKQMTRADLAEQLRMTAKGITSDLVRDELAPVLPPAEVAGLELRLAATIRRLAQLLS